MRNRGYSRDATQCRVKLKELRQAYQKTKESNGRSGTEPRHATSMLRCMQF
ncbi:hypothetical protein UY3_14782 [Chelonia mydas]|uniref:Myb/SANT-like DNA-binding domain-containing protein n=1 Tax=Chelonia mydas TaxID=8469 RepID=M7BIR3_CHEMY|nr:hypothetical protein UY3_14782 [Chelonia mydas]